MGSLVAGTLVVRDGCDSPIRVGQLGRPLIPGDVGARPRFGRSVTL
jgi:hypothetical protein